MDLPSDPSLFYTLAGSLFAALAAVAVLRLTSPRDRPAPGHDPDEIRFVFAGRRLVDISPQAAPLLPERDRTARAWDRLCLRLGARFPGLADVDPEKVASALHFLPASDEDSASLTLEPGRQWTVLTLDEQGGRQGAPSAEADGDELALLQRTLDAAPHPIWRTGDDGALVWANESYRALAARVRPDDPADLPRLFEHAPDPDAEDGPRRVQLERPGKAGPAWFDIVSVAQHGCVLHYATDMNAAVSVEITHRNFIQTLAKTFAQLSTGLAIFDRRRQLALFNPALMDLTTLPAEFLSRRPDLNSFFDRLRETRIMPEPKNYASWRERLATLVTEASNGEYSETWSPSTGQTYRLSGRPHPDGGIAFLLEDITAEITLTRRFRTELEQGQAVLDTLEDAVAVFSASGTLITSNRAYRELWADDAGDSLQEVTIGDATGDWEALCQPSTAFGELRDSVTGYGERAAWESVLDRLEGDRVLCRVNPLPRGATLIRFGSAEGTPPSGLAEGRTMADA